MNLQCALDTLKRRLIELQAGYEYSKFMHLGYACSSYDGEMTGIRYAIDVLEAAMGDAK